MIPLVFKAIGLGISLYFYFEIFVFDESRMNYLHGLGIYNIVLVSIAFYSVSYLCIIRDNVIGGEIDLGSDSNSNDESDKEDIPYWETHGERVVFITLPDGTVVLGVKHQ